jgi:deoxyhypusine synthase
MNGPPPSKATDAVLVPSDPVPQDAQQVKGINWDALPDEQRAILADFVHNLSGQGFQSSSIGEAIDIINDMVRPRTSTSVPPTYSPF